MYLKWNCTKHGNYRFQEKYRPRCIQCFTAMKEELLQVKVENNKICSKYIQATFEVERYEDLFKRRWWEFIRKLLRLKTVRWRNIVE